MQPNRVSNRKRELHSVRKRWPELRGFAIFSFLFSLFGQKFKVDEKCNGKLRSAHTHNIFPAFLAKFLSLWLLLLPMLLWLCWVVAAVCCFCQLHSSCSRQRQGNATTTEAIRTRGHYGDRSLKYPAK